MIRVQDISSSYLQDFSAYWCIDAHDNDYGAVTDITFSHDGKYLVLGKIVASSFMCLQLSNLRQYNQSTKLQYW